MLLIISSSAAHLVAVAWEQSQQSTCVRSPYSSFFICVRFTVEFQFVRSSYDSSWVVDVDDYIGTFLSCCPKNNFVSMDLNIEGHNGCL